MKKKSWFLVGLFGVFCLLWFYPVSDSAAETLKIGALHPTTGGAAYHGIGEERGNRLAVEAINKRGGVKVGGVQYQLELIHYDTEAKPDKGVAALQRLITLDKVNFIIGPLLSGVASAIVPVVARYPNVLLLVDGATVDGIQNNPNVYRTQAVIRQYGDALIKYVKSIKPKAVAMLTDRLHTGYMAERVDMAKEFENAGIKVVAQEYFNFGESNFYSQLTKIKPLKPEVLIIGAYVNEGAAMVKQGKELGLDVQYVWEFLAPEEIVLKTTTAEIMKGVINCTVPPLSELVMGGHKNAIQLDKLYRETFKETPGELTHNSWDAVFVLAKVLEKAGSTDIEKVKKALDDLRVDELPEVVNIYKPYEGGKLFQNHQAYIYGTTKVWEGSKWKVIQK